MSSKDAVMKVMSIRDTDIYEGKLNSACYYVVNDVTNGNHLSTVAGNAPFQQVRQTDAIIRRRVHQTVSATCAVDSRPH